MVTRTRSGRPGLIRWLAASSVALASCAFGAGQSSDERAERAGIAMSKERNGSPIQMAARVVGEGEGGTIEVLVAEKGATEGRIVLRITEHVQTGYDSQTEVRCYEYRLGIGSHLDDPRHIDCPDLPALTIPPARPGPSTTIYNGG